MIEDAQDIYSQNILQTLHGFYVKHPCKGGGEGVYFVKKVEGLQGAVSKVLESTDKVLIQEAIPSLLLPKGPSKFDLRVFVLHFKKACFVYSHFRARTAAVDGKPYMIYLHVQRARKPVMRTTPSNNNFHNRRIGTYKQTNATGSKSSAESSLSTDLSSYSHIIPPKGQEDYGLFYPHNCVSHSGTIHICTFDLFVLLLLAITHSYSWFVCALGRANPNGLMPQGNPAVKSNLYTK